MLPIESSAMPSGPSSPVLSMQEGPVPLPVQQAKGTPAAVHKLLGCPAIVANGATFSLVASATAPEAAEDTDPEKPEEWWRW